jgi:hypothetical protein
MPDPDEGIAVAPESFILLMFFVPRIIIRSENPTFNCSGAVRDQMFLADCPDGNNRVKNQPAQG